MRHHKPHFTILFLASIVGGMYLMPLLDMVSTYEVDVEIPDWSELLEEDIPLEVDTVVIVADVEVEVYDTLKVDRNRWVPEYARYSAEDVPDSLKLYGNEMARAKLYRFFERLEMIDVNDDMPLSIFHFGDSQIEGDRISGVLRSSWQKS
jgi:hypothetical protein